MFRNDVRDALIEAARQDDIEPAALLALAEVETAGDPFEQDRRTPRLLFERHVFYRELAKRRPGKLAAATAAGLAIPKWSRATQYKDQGRSADRLALIARACEIDQDCALRSTSWGIGQTIGFLAEELGFSDAMALVRHQTGSLAGQIDCMVRELRRKKLVGPLNAHAWPVVARGYNGPAFAENSYDMRLADAHKRWERRLETLGLADAVADPAVPLPPARPEPEDALSPGEVEAIQRRLLAKGYVTVGRPDGIWGGKTSAAVRQFQDHEGLPVTGHWDEATAAAFAEAQPVPVPRERREATAEDLRDAGSRTIKATDNLSLWGRLMKWLGYLMGGGVVADQGGLFERAQDAADKVHQARGVWDSVSDLVVPVLRSPGVVIAAVILLAAGFVVWRLAKKIEAARLDDHRTGSNAVAGPVRLEG